MTIRLSCQALTENEDIPRLYTCEGGDVSPPLVWEGAPPGAASFALIVDDLDAAMPGFAHWVVFNLPAGTGQLPEGIPKVQHLENGGAQGRNDFGDLGYSGPCPPPGPAHHYRFRVYALDATLNLDPGASKDEALKAMHGHVLEAGETLGRYQRQLVAARLV